MIVRGGGNVFMDIYQMGLPQCSQMAAWLLQILLQVGQMQVPLIPGCTLPKMEAFRSIAPKPPVLDRSAEVFLL